ncbi:unnamed protein product [Urochloa humidicola]
MLLWDGATGEVASFTTRFDFIIDPLPPQGINNKGTGMAFFLAAYPSSLPHGSEAYNMGLTNQKPDAVAAGDARFVAVEFDTFNDTAALDPDRTYDHIGIDVNSIRSVATEILPSFSLIGNLTAEIRMKIVLGLGSALLYLHEEWEQCVVHRDVKPSNVMLDESFNAKLGDFGLARFIDHAVGMQTMTAVSGTPGYVDPESLITGQASAESDVYSFGVVVLEVTCGRRPMSLQSVSGGGGGQKNAVFRLVEWVWDLYGQGCAIAAADERLRGEHDTAEVERAVAVGLWCAHPDPRSRPSIRAAMAALQSNALLPALPAKMPVPTYAAPPVTLPEGLFSYNAVSSSGVTSSSSTQSSLTPATQTSRSSDTSTSTSLLKDSSSLLKHQY